MTTKNKHDSANELGAARCSLAVAALLVFKYDDEFSERIHYSTGDPEFAHAAIDRAGRKQLGPITNQVVAKALAASPYWEADGWTTGWGGRRARTYIPSDLGEGKF